MERIVSAAGVRPLILTAKLDGKSQAAFEALRERYFPPQRNVIPAHLSLFNQLPGEQLERVRDDLREICAEVAVFAARVDGLRFLGKGVAYTLSSAELESFHCRLASRWEPWLWPQDRQGLSAHITVQNKVTPQSARRLYNHLQSTSGPAEATIEGVSLWRYLGGPWKPIQEFHFCA